MTNKKARLEDIIRNVGGSFDIAPSGIVLSTLEQELSGEISRESRLWETLKNLKKEYDYILIDCPPNLGILTINALCAAEEVIIPVEASRFSLEGLAQLVEIINLIRDRLNHRVEHHVLVTNFDSRLRHSFKMLDYIRATFRRSLFSTIVHVNVKLKEAQSNGSHILDFDKYCRGAKDYFSLSREIITLEKNKEEPIIKEAIKIVQAPAKTRELEKHMEKVLKEELSEFIFSLKAPHAKEVHVVGDFNGWKVGNDSTMEINDGNWRKRVNLNPGRYHYRFVIDGNWAEDPENPAKVKNPFGELNSIVEIKKD